jgi:hypothetical protein
VVRVTVASFPDLEHVVWFVGVAADVYFEVYRVFVGWFPFKPERKRGSKKRDKRDEPPSFTVCFRKMG